jgi:hypothetical protein
MSDALVFLAWRCPGIYGLATALGGPVPRLEGILPLEMRERDGSGPPRTGDPCFEIMGPGDVAGLQRHTIRRMVPPPGTLDAETTKCVHVEFAAPDLPWRYTPALASGQVLDPWIVIVVGTAFDPPSGLGEVKLLPDNQVRLHPDVLAAHPLGESARWAHVQIELRENHPNIESGSLDLNALIESEGGVPVARLLSPRPLEPGRDYIAAIVPAFNPDGSPAWTGANGPVVRPLITTGAFGAERGATSAPSPPDCTSARPIR